MTQRFKPSNPKLVRLRRGTPGHWEYWFPGFREKTSTTHVPAALWRVERLGSFQYRVSAPTLPQPRVFQKLDAVRTFIASQYEYLP
jgi:hypothetical protein